MLNYKKILSENSSKVTNIENYELIQDIYTLSLNETIRLSFQKNSINPNQSWNLMEISFMVEDLTEKSTHDYIKTLFLAIGDNKLYIPYLDMTCVWQSEDNLEKYRLGCIFMTSYINQYIWNIESGMSNLDLIL